MRLLDVNVILATYRDDHEHHEVVRPWFDQMVAGEGGFTVPSVVWSSFVRLVSRRRVFNPPTPMSDAFEFIRATVVQPGYASLEPGAHHLAIFERVCIEADATGDLATDAYLAALAIEHGATLVSLDRDFARFEGLRWERPG